MITRHRNNKKKVSHMEILNLYFAIELALGFLPVVGIVGCDSCENRVPRSALLVTWSQLLAPADP